jgi:hypothetical protein
MSKYNGNKKIPAGKSVSRLAWILLFLLWTPLSAQGAWDFSRHSIPPSDIISGGPLRDGIPALFHPDYLPAGEARFMKDNEQVLGVFINDVARAYPLRILSWHELVNDDFGPDPILVSW